MPVIEEACAGSAGPLIPGGIYMEIAALIVGDHNR